MPLVDVRAYSPAPVRGAATASRSSRAQQSPLPMNVQLLSDDLENGRSAAADAHDSDTHVTKYAHKRPTRCCVRFGNTYVLCSCSSSYGMFPTTCHVGPNWPCMLLTYFISLGPTLLLLFARNGMSLVLQIILIVSMVITTASFSFVACSDPGVIWQPLTPPPDAAIGAERGVICAQCQVRRPLSASHCYDCGVCIDDWGIDKVLLAMLQLDHHCPWTGKCIGKRTIRVFYVFLGCITAHIVVLAITVTMTYVTNS